MSFWSDKNLEPKRQYRWLLSIATAQIPHWVVKSVDKPVMTVGTPEHKFFGHTFKFPGNVTWNDINISLIDPVQPDSVNLLANLIYQGGYSPPAAVTSILTSMSKKKVTDAIGQVFIRQVDAEGAIIEEWTLWNPIVKSADFGGALNYDQEGLIECKLTLAYDWAALKTENAGRTTSANGITPTLRPFYPT